MLAYRNFEWLLVCPSPSLFTRQPFHCVWCPNECIAEVAALIIRLFSTEKSLIRLGKSTACLRTESGSWDPLFSYPSAWDDVLQRGHLVFLLLVVRTLTQKQDRLPKNKVQNLPHLFLLANSCLVWCGSDFR